MSRGRWAFLHMHRYQSVSLEGVSCIISLLSLQGICHQPGGGLPAPDPLQNRGPSGGLRSRAAHLRGEVSAWWGEQLPHLLPCLPHHSGASRSSPWGHLGQVPSGAGFPPRARSPLLWQAEQSGAGGEYHRGRGFHYPHSSSGS